MPADIIPPISGTCFSGAEAAGAKGEAVESPGKRQTSSEGEKEGIAMPIEQKPFVDTIGLKQKAKKIAIAVGVGIVLLIIGKSIVNWNLTRHKPGGAEYVQKPAGTTAAAPVQPPVPEGFVRIQGGTFSMGSPSTEPGRGDDETQHEVTVSSFYMGKHEVTQGEYEAVMGTNPSYFKGDNLPVENVSWYDAVEYCNALSRKEGRSPAYRVKGTEVTWNRGANGYRLPTEAEWEYACRAGTTTPFNTGNNITTGQANYDGNYPYNGNEKGQYRQKTTPVGSFAANGWGLYDMHGNVWEWCWDWYGSYPSGSQTDPFGASSGVGRVDRGGSWGSYALNLRSANRSYYGPSYRYNYGIGFRLVCS